MNTLPENSENRYTGQKIDADSKYDSQIALRANPDYEPLRFCMKYTVMKNILHLTHPPQHVIYFEHR